ncbi:MAG: hypothetical protein EG823_03395 [Actinobacteria bacterium]|nr:hypothetical protein [Actinomycetota bacterium]
MRRLSAHRGWGSAAYYVAVGVVAIILGVWVLGLAGHITSTPIAYADDGVAASAGVKGIAENGQPYTNPSLGAPGEADFRDFPNADAAFVAIVWVLSRFTGDYVTVLNLFALLTYPLIAIAAAWSLRKLKVTASIAAVCALLYALLPFHQSRVTFHLFLSAYFVAPLVVALVADVILRAPDEPMPGRKLLGLPLWAWGVVLLLGTCGIYYAYFGLALIVLGATMAAYRDRSRHALLLALTIIAGVAVLLAVQMAPSYAYWSSEGRNNTGDRREPVEADFFGLRLTQLVYPMDGHRIERFAAAKQFLHDSLEMISPNMAFIAYDSSLGIIGVLGLLMLGFWALSAPFRAPPGGRFGTPGTLALVGVGSFLLGTVGGVGSLIAFLAFPQIRAYDRITVFVAFASIAAVAWVADSLLGQHDQEAGGTRRIPAAIVLGLLLVVGLLDQTNPAMLAPDYTEIGALFDSDAKFVASIEAEVEPGALVFQLPYVTYPEGPAPEGTGVYDPLRLYLHSSDIHWSAGAFLGREAATWQAETADLETDDLLGALAEKGFDGLTIDRRGYGDGGRRLEADLTAALGDPTPIESPDGRYVFYALAE